MSDLEFNETVESYTTSTKAHADDFNKRQEKLLENDKYLKSQLADVAKFDRKTYVELKTLKDSNQLKEGKRYILTDYRTKYKQPDTNVIKEMEVEELVLTAIDKDTFEPIVYSSKYPQDTIWYDFNNNKCEDNSTPRNGFITRRYDHITGNNAPQDWRTMLWARWKPDAQQYYKNDVLTNYEVWTSGNAKMGVVYKAGNKLLVAHNTNVPKTNSDLEVFTVIYNDINIGMLRREKTKIISLNDDKLELAKGVLYERLTFGERCIENRIIERNAVLHNDVFGDDCKYNILEYGAHNNTFGNGWYANIFGINCYNNDCYGYSGMNNIFGNSCNNNSLGNNCSDNTFGSGCNNNNLGNNCYGNSFGNRNRSNTLGSDCYSNSLGSGSSYNRFNNSCDYNNLGNDCSYNNFGFNFDSNTLGNNCDYNNFGDNCDYNKLGNDCNYNNFGDNCYFLYIKALRDKSLENLDIHNKSHTINIERNSSSKYIYWYLDGNNQPVYEIIP